MMSFKSKGTCVKKEKRKKRKKKKGRMDGNICPKIHVLEVKN
jgi:hypothetical protein